MAAFKVNKPLVRFAISHPIVYSLISALVMVPWISFLFRNVVYGLVAGAVMFLLQVTLWVPGGAIDGTPFSGPAGMGALVGVWWSSCWRTQRG
jgi:hypothetical protein